MSRSSIFLISILGAVALTAACPLLSVADNSKPHFSRVMTVIFENAGYTDVLNQSFFAQFANEGALFTHFMAEAHPSQPNYIALTSGGTQGVTGDGSVTVNAKNIVDLLEAHGKTWKVYVEAYPGKCFTGTSSGTYARKHVPFISYSDIQKNPTRCAHIVNSSELDTDIQNGTLPDYSFYVPDLNDDGHDTDAATASQWFSNAFGPRLQNPAFSTGMLVIATYDEAEPVWVANQIYTAVYGDSVIPGTQDSTQVNHYSLLKMIEDNFSLGNLGGQDATATAIDGIWK